MPEPLKHKRKGPKSTRAGCLRKPEAAKEETASRPMILGAFTLHVETFVPEPYMVKRPIPISLQRRAGGYIASFVEANVNSSGDTQREAVANVKELILDIFDSLPTLPSSKLGPGPARQLAVLREFIDVAVSPRRGTGIEPGALAPGS